MEHWEKLNSVQRMQDFIRDNIAKPITLHDLASAANYSPWHCSRVFKELIGIPPFEYIRKLRMSKAAAALKGREVRVIDVAFDFVFDSHEGFTRAFSKQFGLSPREYAKKTPSVKLFMPQSAKEYYLKLQRGDIKMSKESKNLNTVFVQVTERPERKLVLKRGKKATHYFEYCEEVGCEIWESLCSIKEAIYEPVGLWLPENLIKNGTSAYVQGVEVSPDYKGEVPEGCEIIDLKPCKMMVFQGQPFDDEKFESAIGDLWEVMKSYDPEVYGFTWADEDGPRIQLEPRGYRGYIEARPVRTIN